MTRTLNTVPEYLEYLAEVWGTITITEDLSKYDPKAPREYVKVKVSETPFECQLKWATVWLRQGYIDRTDDA